MGNEMNRSRRGVTVGGNEGGISSVTHHPRCSSTTPTPPTSVFGAPSNRTTPVTSIFRYSVEPPTKSTNLNTVYGLFAF